MASINDQSKVCTIAENKRRKHDSSIANLEQLSSKRSKLEDTMERIKSQESLIGHEFQENCNFLQDDYNSSSEEKLKNNVFNTTTSDDEYNLLSYYRPKSQPPSPKITEFVRRISSPNSTSEKSPTKYESNFPKNESTITTKSTTENDEKQKAFLDNFFGKKKLKTQDWFAVASKWTTDKGFADQLTFSVLRQNKVNPQNISSPSSMSSWNEFSPSKYEEHARNVPKRQFNKFSSNNTYNLDGLKSLSNDVTFIDTHCHLDFLFKHSSFKKNSHLAYREEHKDSYPSCYEGCVAIFCDPKTFRDNSWKEILCEDKVWAAFGCHPHKADFYNEEIEIAMKEALKHKKVVALGEIGLDYSNRNNSNRAKQKEIFRAQLKIAIEFQLPLVIHSRDATMDSLNIMKEILPRDYKIHRHCFTGNWAEAKDWLDEFPNLYLGLTNLVTFANVKEVHEVAREIPIDRLLLETDAPYFLPRLENKEKRSNPGMAIHVAAQIAFLRNESLEYILKSTRANTEKMYGI